MRVDSIALVRTTLQSNQEKTHTVACVDQGEEGELGHRGCRFILDWAPLSVDSVVQTTHKDLMKIAKDFKLAPSHDFLRSDAELSEAASRRRTPIRASA
jgi:hypothetical protein